MTIQIGKLVCTYKHGDNKPAVGKVWVEPLNFATDGEVVLVPGGIPFDLVDGELDADVVIDNADITPDLYLRITERFVGVSTRTPYIVKPEGAETNLSTAPRYEIGPVNPGPGEPVPGPPGQAATVTVGSTTTSTAGGNASVTNSGTSSAAVLNFTIPRGSQGPQGLQGVPGADGAQGPEGPAGADGTDTNFAWQTVTTGSEARPSADHVLWVGGSTQPTNMAIGDIWMAEA